MNNENEPIGAFIETALTDNAVKRAIVAESILGIHEESGCAFLSAEVIRDVKISELIKE